MPDHETFDLVPRQCTAMLSNRTRRCRRAPMWGSNVCSKHGGSAPHVKRKAAERLREMIDPALNNLRRAMESHDMSAVVRACLGVLALNGYTPNGTRDDERDKIDTRFVDWFTPEEGWRWVELAEQMKAIEEAATRRMEAGQRPDQTAPRVVVESVLMLPEPEANGTSTPKESV